MKAIICMFIPQGFGITYAYGEFYWSPKHRCHVWGGQTRKSRELDMVEFNKVIDGLLLEQDFFGQRTVRILADEPAAKPVPTPPPVIPDNEEHREAAAQLDAAANEGMVERPKFSKPRVKRGKTRRSKRPTVYA